MPTMGSLFDGIGGFVLAGARHGIKTLWASEIEAFPIAVTSLRFPDMLHVGDITKLDGATLPPVDIICGGSPCQDLSVAGKRAGLTGARSGLFLEQIRVIREMRDEDKRNGRADHHVRPRYGIWENVPGAFSSGEPKGEDFRIVLEEFIRIADGGLSVPRPPRGRWESAGAVLGDQCSLAWRVYDTQYWPCTPQRRRRIYLVADFGGHTAPQVLFEQDRLLGDTAPSEGARQGLARGAGGSADAAGGTRRVTIPINTQIATRHKKLGEGTGLGIGVDGDAAYTLQEAHSHGVFVSGCLNPWDTQQARIATPDGVSPAVCGADGGGGRNPAGLVMTAAFNPFQSAKYDLCYTEECSPTLRAGSQTAIAQSAESDKARSPIILATQQGGAEIGEGICPTITAAAGMSGNNQPVLFENNMRDARYTGPLEIAPTICAHYGTGGNNLPLVSQDAEDSYCIAGNIIDRQPENGGNGLGCQPNLAYTLTSTDKHAVYQRTVGALCCGDEKGIGNQYVSQDKCIVMPKKLIRRLTPLECERLQGFPDFWTDIPGASDSARYKALGNSVAIPCAEHVLRGVSYFLKRGDDKDA